MSSHSLTVLASLDPAVPATLARLVEDLEPSRAPAAPRAAASVVLCRDGESGLETYLLHRHARMAFAASMVVFPGGGVDPVDRSAPDPLLACGIRETREETGVDLTAAELVRWAHWITPVVQPIRYDTYFYLAALPAGETAADLSTETDRAAWTAPAAAVAGVRGGRHRDDAADPVDPDRARRTALGGRSGRACPGPGDRDGAARGGPRRRRLGLSLSPSRRGTAG